ncbi:DUF892 family protein [Sulfitobacter sp. F26169L]|uniref:DUF892 family protein n=1 Tax=Sulfitobacter sp. F26169L TaxID=2996015 RepID=UPI002260E0B8|nr:DUF892 family protein [Sulfitobacter sp. F26169L]MCX7567713.1 DUF892 family protein [Sulfitobacter sp. F26169L]
MRIDTLEDLYIEQLKDLYSANTQALDVTKALGQVARNRRLVHALRAGVGNISEGIATLENIAVGHEEEIMGTHCEGMEGLVKDARAQALEEFIGEETTKDAMIIIQYQRLAHYAIAGYASLVAFADHLELDQDLMALKICLAASHDDDHTMMRLATDNINEQARH